MQERISQFVSRNNNQNNSAGGDDSQGVSFQQEFSQLKIDNDMVNTFFDESHKMSDHFTFNFIETLKLDFEIILTTLYQSSTECATFFTYLLGMLRRLSPIDGSFTNTLLLCKQTAVRINSDAGTSPAHEFNKFFTKHLFRSYCALIRECPNKRQQICELIYAHCQHDLTLRIKIVQSLKKYLKDDELVYACQAHLLNQETQFNEQWFDVFLYYALIGLSNQRVNIRSYSINMLSTIAKHNPDAMLEVCEKISNLADEAFWELKTQSLEFAATILTQFRSHSHVLAVKDDLKSGAAAKPSSNGVLQSRSMSGNLRSP